MIDSFESTSEKIYEYGRFKKVPQNYLEFV